MKRQTLLYGDGITNSDILYFTGLNVPDPIFAFTLGGKKCALISALEMGRAVRSKKLGKIFDLSAMLQGDCAKNESEALAAILKRERVYSLLVPGNFPARQLDYLRASGFDVKVAEAQIFPERAVKTAAEISEIVKANSVASAGFAVAEEMLRQSEISENRLLLDGAVLTSEMIRTQIEKTAISLGADAVNTIVAAGDQACDPHEVGHGPIEPNSLIVIDIFPRLRASGYFGDMTRTFLKGRPRAAQRKLVETVLHAQKVGIEAVRAGVNGADVHNLVKEVFEAAKYRTACKKGVWGGFFHSTGHGLGLDVHESPSLGLRDNVLRTGNVVTVEPGLYYRGLGGCRIEDNVAVRKNGADMLSEYHYEWIIS